MADPAIMLFGKTIPLTESGSGSDSDPNLTTTTAEEDMGICNETANDEIKDEFEVQKEMEQGELNSSSAPSENDQQTSSQIIVQISDSKTEPDQCETDASGPGQDKVLKKPDKIIPCPRCNSLDTKFCYYNNYNVNQQRHFCKNCQRYWTAGGTMRNVPVGAGRRKNKHSASLHYRQIMMSPEALATARGEAIDSCRPPITIKSSSERNGTTVFKFRPEAQSALCESTTSVLNIVEQKRSEVRSEEPSCVSSMPASNLVENQNILPENTAHKEQPNPNGMQGYYPLQCYPWAYPWSTGWNNAAAAAAAATGMTAGRCSSELVDGSEMCNMSSIQWGPLPILAAPSFCAPFPIPFVPPPAFWPTGAWNVPWVGGSTGGLSTLSSKSNSGCLGSSSPTLGKHSRDGSLQGESNTETSLWVPKTLRIDDPDEAAKSSIWATLGIKPYEGGGIFKPLQSKDEDCPKSEASKVLHANPAAVSRFQSFQEST